jgi:hypothetical protein
MLNTTPAAAIAGAAPGAPARRIGHIALDDSENVRRNLGLAFDEEAQPEQHQPATPNNHRVVPVPGAPLRLAGQPMELRVDTDVRRNLDDLFANTDWALSWSVVGERLWRTSPSPAEEVNPVKRATKSSSIFLEFYDVKMSKISPYHLLFSKVAWFRKNYLYISLLFSKDKNIFEKFWINY